ncbi:hypothetical protein TWF696_005469 [Orbilia brochopaga]|uniref:Homing endonuclease LAGLIDADG domain-containing protein n=1 Tax=Orbilia brochopaga TaxID=3140254 RepID=A0AAV9V7F4_9PEZI
MERSSGTSHLDDVTRNLATLSIAPGSSLGGATASLRIPGPIDEYFIGHTRPSGTGFKYNPQVNTNVRKTFNRLARAYRWGDSRRDEEKEKFFEAIDAEFTKRFGDGSDLTTWQWLVGLFGYDDDEIPTSLTKCKKILSELYINIYDFLHYCRRMNITKEDGVKRDLRFLSKASLNELRVYSKSRNLLYPLDLARGNVLRGFLVHMFG